MTTTRCATDRRCDVATGVVIHGVGLDEISPLGPASVIEIRNVAPEGEPKKYERTSYSWDPLTEVTARAARLFGFFDVDGHGVLDTAGMTQRLQQIGKEIDTAGTEQLFVDITGMPQGTVSRDEFTSYLVSSDFRV